MSPEMLTIIGAAIALAAVILPGQQAMRRDITDLRERMTHLEKDLSERMARLEKDLSERMARLEKDLSERMARLEGLFEGFTSGNRQPPSA